MAVTTGDMYICLSGGSSNTAPSASLGGTKSYMTITNATAENLFDHVSASEASAGDVEYRGFFLHMSNSSDTLYNATLWISASTSAPGDEIAIATDTAGVKTTPFTMSTIANEGTAPTATGSWNAYNETISIGNMAPSTAIGIWMRRSVSAGAASAANDSSTIAWRGETA